MMLCENFKNYSYTILATLSLAARGKLIKAILLYVAAEYANLTTAK